MRNSRQLLMTETNVQQTPWSIPLLWAAWIALVLGFALSHVVQMDTYYPERFSFIWWTEMLVFITRLALIFALLFRLVNYTSPWAINFAFMFILMFVLMECCVIAAKAIVRPSLNKSPLNVDHPGSALNVGNDPLYCCLYGNETLSLCNFSNSSLVCRNPNVNITGLLPNNLKIAVEFEIAFYLSILMCILGGLMFFLSVLAKRTLYAMRTYTDAEGYTVKKELVELENIGGKEKFNNEVHERFD